MKFPNLPIKIKTNQTCVKCGVCVKAFPVKAISFYNPSCTDKSKCITYMRCVAVCPKRARNLLPVLLSIVGTISKIQFKGRKELYDIIIEKAHKNLVSINSNRAYERNYDTS